MKERIKADLHVHTSFSSDCTVPPWELMEEARRQGLRALAITDHNTVEGALRAGGLEGLIVLPGIELSTRDGHLVLLGVNEQPAPGISAAEACDLARTLGAVAIVPHPYRLFTGAGAQVASTINAHAIEGLNGRSLRRDNLRAIALAHQGSKACVGGSDAHAVNEIGAAYTLLPECASADDVLDAILRGECEPGGSHASVRMALSRGMGGFSRYLGRGLKRI